jgi:hypothetical protein
MILNGCRTAPPEMDDFNHSALAASRTPARNAEYAALFAGRGVCPLRRTGKDAVCF